MYLTLVFGTDANSTESSSQQSTTPTDSVSQSDLQHADPSSDHPLTQHADPSSDHPLTQDTEVLLFGLKSNTQYKATVYSQAADGTEGQPRNITFRTGMLNFDECLQPESSSTEFCPL